MSFGKAIVTYTTDVGGELEKEFNFRPPPRTHREPVNRYVERVDKYVGDVVARNINRSSTNSIKWVTDLGYRNFQI